MKVAITCIQLLRDIAGWRNKLESSGCILVLPDVPGQHLEGDELVRALDGCIGVIAGDDRFSRDVLERLPDLKIISKWGIGVDGIDADAARERGIVVRNTPGVFDDEVADVTMAYVVMLARHLAAIDRGVHTGGWPKPVGTSLRDSTLGIVGLGGIGRATARRALIAGMHVVGVDPAPISCAAAAEIGVEIADLTSLLTNSDFVAVTCPLVPATHHLLDDEAFAMIKTGARIVNTARGAVVDTHALVRALRSGKVSAAALDVLEDEPPGAEHPILQFEQVVVGSHNASNTLEASFRVHGQAIQNLLDELPSVGR